MLPIYVNISLHFQDYVTVNEFPLQLFKGSIFAAHEGKQNDVTLFTQTTKTYRFAALPITAHRCAPRAPKTFKASLDHSIHALDFRRRPFSCSSTFRGC